MISTINVKPNCGNSPKMRFLTDFYTASIEGNFTFLSENITDDIRLEIVGQETILGKDKFLEIFVQKRFANIIELSLDSIITHGIEASVAGSVLLKSGDRFQFCDLYRFQRHNTHRIKSVKSFLVRFPA